MKLANNFPSLIQDTVHTVAGVVIAGFALKSFLVPNQFLDGGVTGVSLLLHEMFHWNLAMLIILVNLPFIIIGSFLVNRKFALKTLACVVLLSLCLEFLPYPVVTSEKILVSMFGGLFLGIGIGLAMRGGCAIDGLEILALYTMRRSSFTISEIILGLNVIIFLLAAMHFGLERALFAMLTYFVASRTIHYVIEGLEEYTGVTIISGRSQEIKEALVLQTGRGITVYKGERGFLKDSFEISTDCDIVFTVVTRLEVRRLKNLVHSIDPNSFIFTHRIKEAAGGVLKRRASH
ncbi:YitT family protein [Taibaiella soli]|uniref:DUF2179 domain-containing protein n=1 Tax=Taibaiella soli TaxID=1649169 RepID=A0A2W2B9N7_9BACT|nr:YitT family protein [Taibaiella soli]PZF72627.1 hypothetical protein DN068_12235 [Taibaiella soli]